MLSLVMISPNTVHYNLTILVSVRVYLFILAFLFLCVL
jgi:hypothetical protein